MATTTESIGRVLAGRYRIESALGSGASAHVYAAWDTTLQRRVAIKVLHPGLAEDEGFLRRFRAEAQSAAALAHAHVLAVHDWGEDARGPFLVMEYLGGGSLRDMFDDGRRLSVSQAVVVGLQAAEGLAYAHGRGFVHRDVKPANLLFDDEGRLRIADFGLARALAEAALTEPAGATVGTARYAAPEQALGRAVDGRADVYSLALVLYEAVTGSVPFAAETTIATLMARVGERLPGHDALGPLAEVLDAAAAPDVGDRLDAAALAERLRALTPELPRPERLPLAGAGGQGLAPARPAGLERDDRTEHGMLAPEVLAAGARGADGAVVHAPRRRRRRWPWVTAAVVLVAGLLGTGGALFLVKEKPFTPTRKLASLVGLTTPEATLKVHASHFRIVVGGRQSSIPVGAGVILSQTPPPGRRLKEGSTVSVVLSSGPPPVMVPDLHAVTGDCPAIATVLKQAHLQAACSDVNSTTTAQGGVIDWNPKGLVPWGSAVDVTVSSGPPIESIPPLTGSTCTGATTALKAVGLVANCVNQYSTTVPSGQVVSWSPQSTAPEGATVTVTISQGPPPVVIPSDVIGMTVSDAITALENVGLVPGTNQGPLSGRVFQTNPAAGTSVPAGSTITLYSK